MVRSEHAEEAASVVISLDTRRARLRRRRRRHAIREWLGLAVAATVGVWLAAAAVLTLVAH
jgi:hypothetical protein